MEMQIKQGVLFVRVMTGEITDGGNIPRINRVHLEQTRRQLFVFILFQKGQAGLKHWL